MAEMFYAKLITLCQEMYYSEHIHVFDYRLSHAEQIMRQGRLDEATRLSEAILVTCESSSEWPHPRKLPADHCRVLPVASQPRRGADVPAENAAGAAREAPGPRPQGDGQRARRPRRLATLHSSRHADAKDLYARVLVLARPRPRPQTRRYRTRHLPRSPGASTRRPRPRSSTPSARQSDPDARLLGNPRRLFAIPGQVRVVGVLVQAADLRPRQLRVVLSPGAHRSSVAALVRHWCGGGGGGGDAGGLRRGGEAAGRRSPGGRRLPTNPPARDVRRFGSDDSSEDVVRLNRCRFRTLGFATSLSVQNVTSKGTKLFFESTTQLQRPLIPKNPHLGSVNVHTVI